jgi:heptosyltransferase-3
MGDIIAAEPVARHLKNTTEYLVWLVQPRYQDLLRYNPYLDAVQTVSSYTETILLRKLLPNIRWSNLHFDGYRCDRFGLPCHNKILQGLNADNYYNFGTLADVFALTGTGKILDKKPRVYQNPDFNATSFLASIFAQPEKPLYVLQVKSDDAARSWDAVEAQKTADWLNDNTDFNCIEVGLAPVLKRTPRTHQLGGRLSLSQQIAVIQQAKLFIGVDSGFAHIANALSIPSILLLGDFRGFSPYLPWHLGEHDTIIRAPGQTNTITANQMISSIQEALTHLI